MQLNAVDLNVAKVWGMVRLLLFDGSRRRSSSGASVQLNAVDLKVAKV